MIFFNVFSLLQNKTLKTKYEQYYQNVKWEERKDHQPVKTN
jgi:hypothetical protein